MGTDAGTGLSSVVARCAQFETIPPLPLETRPATGMERKREALVGRAQFGPALLLNRRITPALLELAYWLNTGSQVGQALIDSRWTGSAR